MTPGTLYDADLPYDAPILYDAGDPDVPAAPTPAAPFDLWCIDPDDGTVLALVEYEWLEWKTKWIEPSTLAVTVKPDAYRDSPLDEGMLLWLRRDEAIYRIEQIHLNAVGFLDPVKISCRDLVGFAYDERVCLPPVGLSHDRQTTVPGETALKHYVRANAADLAAASRQIPNLAVSPDLERGSDVSVAARYQTVGAIAAEIGQQAGVSASVVYDRATNAFALDVIEGTDRSGMVFIDPELETADAMAWLQTVLGSKSVAVVGGQGDLEDREVQTHWIAGSEPQGFARREMFVDARDLGEPADLPDRAKAKIRDTREVPPVQVTVTPGGLYTYGQDYEVGDIVTARSRRWGLTQDARIVAATVTIGTDKSAAGAGMEDLTSPSPDNWVETTTIEIGSPWPTLRGKLIGDTELELGSAIGATRT